VLIDDGKTRVLMKAMYDQEDWIGVLGIMYLGIQGLYPSGPCNNESCSITNTNTNIKATTSSRGSHTPPWNGKEQPASMLNRLDKIAIGVGVGTDIPSAVISSRTR
jgi:hypothetical protein